MSAPATPKTGAARDGTLTTAGGDVRLPSAQVLKKTRTCTDCAAPITPKSTTGLCAPCSGARSVWTPATVDHLCAMLNAGESRTSIAMAIGVNRPALAEKIGRMRRAGDPRVPPALTHSGPLYVLKVDPLADVPRVSREVRLCFGVPEDRPCGCRRRVGL